MVDLLLRVACHGGGDEPLNVHLKRITESAYTRKTLGGAAVAGQVIAPVIAESHDEQCRLEIMKYLRECLSEASGKRWQRIYGGLALTESLMRHGSHELISEVSQGRHFDLVQKVSLLEKFNAAARGCPDRRAQAVIRTKATEVKTMLVVMLERARAEENAVVNDHRDAESSCSSKGKSWATTSTAASSTESEHIDDAFAALREWVDSAESCSVSAQTSPRTSEISLDEDWEPLHYSTTASVPRLVERTPTNIPDGGNELFFTPVTPAAMKRYGEGSAWGRRE